VDTIHPQIHITAPSYHPQEVTEQMRKAQHVNLGVGRVEKLKTLQF
jgi:hypothetical protein